MCRKNFGVSRPLAFGSRHQGRNSMPNRKSEEALEGSKHDSGVEKVPRSIRIRVNGSWHNFNLEGDLSASSTLAYVLREKLGYTGLKVSCDEGACGACTIIQDGKAMLSCMMLAVESDGHDVLTIEGLPADDPVVEAFAEQSEPGYGTAMQCGYCTPGYVMTSRALLNENPTPSMEEIKDALAGNICRCGCYAGIAQAVVNASAKIKARRGGA